MRRRSSSMRPEERISVIAKTRGRCGYCGDDTRNRKQRSGKRPTIDHMTPVARGGTDSHSNLLLCCRDCNSRKADRTVDEFRQHLVIHGLFGRLMHCDKELFFFERIAVSSGAERSE
jgi:5-methylcytosine-specific restriction endonuclease McrA